MCGSPLFKATQVSQFKLRSHMYMYWKFWSVYLSHKIWFRRREGSEAADRSLDCSYWPVVSSIFSLDLRHKLARSIVLSKRTFSKSRIRLWTTFRLSFWHLYNDVNWPLGFLPFDLRRTDTSESVYMENSQPYWHINDNKFYKGFQREARPREKRASLGLQGGLARFLVSTTLKALP